MVLLEGVGTLKKFNNLIGTQTHDLPACSIETKYILLGRHQSAGQTHDIKAANRSFESVAEFTYEYFWNDTNKSELDSGSN
jgi:hypothetical protein